VGDVEVALQAAKAPPLPLDAPTAALALEALRQAGAGGDEELPGALGAAAAAAWAHPVDHRVQLLAAALAAQLDAAAVERAAAASELAATKAALRTIEATVAALSHEVGALKAAGATAAATAATAAAATTSAAPKEPAGAAEAVEAAVKETAVTVVARLEAGNGPEALKLGVPTLLMYASNVLKKPKVRQRPAPDVQCCAKTKTNTTRESANAASPFIECRVLWRAQDPRVRRISTANLMYTKTVKDLVGAAQLLDFLGFK